jgi:hypothetical protein
MKIVSVTCFLLLSVCFVSFGQSPVPTAATATQALQLLQQALTALSPRVATQDTTLTGSVHYVAGATDETGTATLKALASGASSVQLALPSGTQSEIRNLTGNPTGILPTGEWTDFGGVSHNLVLHNLFNEPAWFSPVASITRVLATPQFVASFVGTEAVSSQTVNHVSLTATPADSSAPEAARAHLSRLDLYLDSSTSLPQSLSFDIHPDNDAGLDIPITVQFSDYRSVNGSIIPFHIQRYIDNTELVLDIQLSSATINTGIPVTTFGPQ